MRNAIEYLLLCMMILTLTGCQKTEPVDPAPGQTAPQTEIAEPPPTPVPEPEPFAFTRDNLPRLDGSTATVPLAEAVCATLLGESREDVKDLVHFSKTTQAYYNLMSGDADLLIVYEANEDVYEEKERRGFEWEKTPFANDAFVFVVNEENPVDSITIEQARKIYSGEITNWKELGGEDRAITAFQRNRGAGSQTLMEKLVMQGTPMMDAPAGYVVSEMGALIEAVKGYDGSPGAIGYTVYYYASEMKMAKGLKLLALEGVEPTPETIRSETYPLINPNYAVLPADAPEGAPNRILYDWLLSDEGQRLVAAEGYVSILDLPTGERRVEPEAGSRWYADYADHLIPRDDYGVLIPYAGARLSDDWWAANGCNYGLMTRDGKVVVDPVYSGAYAPVRAHTNGVAERMPLLVLEQYDPASEEDPETLYAVAAADGSWCTESVYNTVRYDKSGLMLFSGDELTLMKPDGSILKRLTRQGIGADESEWSAMQSWEGAGGQWYGDNISLDWDRGTTRADGYHDVVYYSLADNARLTMPYADWDALRASYWNDSDASEEWQEPHYAVEGAERFEDELLGGGAPGLLRTWENGAQHYYREDGTPLPELTVTNSYDDTVSVKGGLVETLELNYATYYDLDTMDVVFRAYLGYEGD